MGTGDILLGGNPVMDFFFNFYFIASETDTEKKKKLKIT